jgi:hypothetical protein
VVGEEKYIVDEEGAEGVEEVEVEGEEKVSFGAVVVDVVVEVVVRVADTSGVGEDLIDKNLMKNNLEGKRESQNRTKPQK